ncbi:phospholipid/glycerol acyltransferase [Oleiphilus messinensis]|uniref:Phospholipid/glycerol acyltransferase n=1 Tax=Oleiphilus messinensis TaxID=141451 RepID=A0A1Y0I2C3_9GAMM|nr:MFS transporter [Oleiphilus messinensis]ARU54410.1 phospholipid/glycerol acyltransferase [Oleiphilus messinensis]
MSTEPTQAPPHQSQFKLLRSRFFGPFFWTQFFGAFNDNVFKNVLLALITFNALYATGLSTDLMNNMGAVLFILPFFIFSALAGQIADKYEKSALIRKIKLFEIGIMSLAAIGFFTNSVWALLGVLFLMGTQSAFFGPVKYSIIPQHLHKDELVGGNAMVEMGTFVAILLGTLGAGLLSKSDHAAILSGITVVILACAGWFASRNIPNAPAPSPELKIRFNPYTETLKTIQISRQNHGVFLAVMAISWFWFLGASYLTQLYSYTKTVLLGDQTVVTVMLAVFSIGIALGSLLCERLSGRKVELGLVPLGSIGLSLFSFDLYVHSLSYVPPALSNAALTTSPLLQQTGDLLQGVGAFLEQANSYRVLFDFLMIGVFGGFYIVPLYAMVQDRSEEKQRSQIIASINILNALFMVGAGISAVIFLSLLKLSIPEYFMILAIMNAVVAVYIYRTIPEFFMRFLVWVITHTMYRVKHRGLEHIPDEGPCVLVCNHVSYMDALILAGACRRPIRFVMFKPIYDLPVLNFIFRTGKTIPIHSQKKDPETYNRAFERISEELQDGEVVCIFPEGKLTTTGEIDTFRKGIEQIIAKDPVPVVPMALQGLWGSFFSHRGGAALVKWPKRFWSKVTIIADAPWAPESVSASALEAKVKALHGTPDVK